MSPTALTIWAALSAKADADGQAEYSILGLAAAVGRSRRSVQYGLRELREAGYIGLAVQVRPGRWKRHVKVTVSTFVDGEAALAATHPVPRTNH